MKFDLIEAHVAPYSPPQVQLAESQRLHLQAEEELNKVKQVRGVRLAVYFSMCLVGQLNQFLNGKMSANIAGKAKAISCIKNNNRFHDDANRFINVTTTITT